MDNLPLKPLVFVKEKLKKSVSPHLTPRLRLPPNFLLNLLLAFLLGRASFFDELTPLGGAFFAASFTGRESYLYALFALGGMFFGGADFPKLGQYIFAMCAFALVYENLGFIRKRPYITRSGLFSLGLALSGAFFTVSSGVEQALFYDAIMLTLETVFTFFFTLAFCAALPVLGRMSLSRTLSSKEEISLVLLLGGALAGLKDISTIGPINIANVICIFIILVFSVRLGAARGAVAGLTMGLVSSLGSGILDTNCVSYAFSGLAAGIAGAYGAAAGCAAFVLANAVITILANGSTEVLINIYDIFAACLLYRAVPDKILSRATGFGARDEAIRAAEDGRDYSVAVVNSLTCLLCDLSERLGTLEKRREGEAALESRLFERIARRACSGCGMRRLCWGRDMKKTYESLAAALEEYKVSGSLSEDCLPRNCLRPNEFKSGFLSCGELYRCETEWNARLRESVKTSAARLAAMIKLTEAAKARLDTGVFFDRALSDDIARRLDESDVEYEDISVMRDCDLDPVVYLTLSGCGGFSLCDNGVSSIVSDACGQRMMRSGKRDCRSCRVKYVPCPSAAPLFAASGVARDKKGVSGDSAGFRVIGKDLYAAVLCDGMGSGKPASEESALSSETLLDFLEAGLDGDDAMEAVSAFFEATGEVTFSAADLLLYNAKTGRSRLIKRGGAAAFSRSGERVDAMLSKTLPLGTGVGRCGETYTFSLSYGDMVVMITDGVIESAAEGAAAGGWIMTELENFRGDDPKRLCDIIVDKALQRCKSKPKDDMTVLAAVIGEDTGKKSRLSAG